MELNLIAEDTNQVVFFGVLRVVGGQLMMTSSAALPYTLPQTKNTQQHKQQQYGMDRRDGHSLATLLRDLGELDGLRWVRILYAYPSYFTDELVAEIATNPKVGWVVLFKCWFVCVCFGSTTT